MTVGIDASRNRSGGAVAHLTGLLAAADPSAHGIGAVHVWAPPSLSEVLPSRPWLVRHSPPALSRSLASQIWWQATRLAGEASAVGCDVLWASDAASVCRFQPLVVLSQDLLCYEPGVMALHGWGAARFRLLALRLVQDAAFRRARHVVFLTPYAARLIGACVGDLPPISIVPHGVDPAFFGVPSAPWPATDARPIRVVYVSNAAPYKHQWVVVEAVARLRGQGLPLVLDLVGGGSGPAQTRLDAAVARWDPDRCFVQQRGAVPAADLPGCLARADLFVFASSCENMPVTLLEAMAAGVPIACAERGPMPELLQEGGLYFDPYDASSLAAAIASLVADAATRRRVSARARELAAAYSWRRCADQTFACLAQLARRVSP